MSSFLKRWWWALLAAAVCLGFWRLRFDVDILNLLPPDEPTVQGLKLYQQHFANARELVISIRAPDAERAERLAESLGQQLRARTDLVAAVSWQPPWMENPAQMAELLACLWLNQPPDDFGALTNRLKPDHLQTVLAQTKETLATSMSPLEVARLAFDPFDMLSMPALTNLSGLSGLGAQQMFASKDGNFRLLYVEAAMDLTSYRTCETWLAAVHGVVAGSRSGESKPEWDGVAVRYTGRPVFVVEIARSMQKDMSGSVTGTAIIIAALFWLTHRRWLPMLWLLALLTLILIATLALGGLVLGTISVMSMGFAAVLLGLAVDYAVVHYQEALSHPHLSVPEIRRVIAPSILWAALTTISAFLALNLGGLPGLAQLGSLVALGVSLAALVMVMIYLPPLFPKRRTPPPTMPAAKWTSYFFPPPITPERAAGCKTDLPSPTQRENSPNSALSPCPPERLTRAEGRSLPPGGAERHGEVSPDAGAPGTPQPGRSRQQAELRAPHLREEGQAEGYVPDPFPPAVHGGRSVPRNGNRAVPVFVTGAILLTACSILWGRFPGLDRSGTALRPQHSEAEAALDEIKSELGLPRDPLWLIVSGQTETEIYRRLTAAEAVLNEAVSNHVIAGCLLPTVLWPRPEHQAANRAAATVLTAEGPLFRQVATGEGFSSNALALTEGLVDTWRRAMGSPEVLWPTNHASQWLLKRFVARKPGQLFVMGMVQPATNKVDAVVLEGLSARLARSQAFLSGWELLGSTTLKRVQAKMWHVVAPMVLLVLAALWFAFRRPTEILLGLAVQLLSGVCLLAIMAAAGWSWNLLNLMSLPLILGTGVDYTLFIQMAMRRHGGDARLVHRSIGRALMLCGGTAMAGFGSLGFSSNPGMASLGKVCAIGIGANMLLSVFLLPSWWRLLNPGAPLLPPRSPGSLSPSAFYRAGLWRLGLALVRFLPDAVAKSLAATGASIYCRCQRQRCELVVQNLLPVLGGDRRAAEQAALELHRNFARKLIDLWQVENGVQVRDWLTNPGELEIIQNARRRGAGILFITLHLGNWEHGGLLLSQLGIPLTILTQAEPDDDLTDLRIASRKRFGVETLVIGQDSFAFIEVLKRLQAGANLALSLDRPLARGGVTVQFFGRPFAAPGAAADLARASGCALIGVTIVRRPDGYAVTVLPEFVYDRRTLGNREARRDLTQQILRAFEPQIRQDISQWYQFVPLWPAGK